MGGRRTSLDEDEAKAVTLAVANEYTAAHGHPGKDYPWLEYGSLVEPHRPTTLTLHGLPARLTSVKPSCLAVHRASGLQVAAHAVTQGSPGKASCDVTFTQPGD